MTRRSWLSAVSAALTGAVLDPERALWIPGKLISIPAPVLRPLHLGIDIIWDLRERMTSATFQERYILPAIDKLTCAVALAGPQYRMEKPELPLQADHAWHVVNTAFRHIGCYDVVNDRFLDRIDVLLVPR
jgi:hypothetical protein